MQYFQVFQIQVFPEVADTHKLAGGLKRALTYTVTYTASSYNTNKHVTQQEKLVKIRHPGDALVQINITLPFSERLFKTDPESPFLKKLSNEPFSK